MGNYNKKSRKEKLNFSKRIGKCRQSASMIRLDTRRQMLCEGKIRTMNNVAEINLKEFKSLSTY